MIPHQDGPAVLFDKPPADTAGPHEALRNDAEQEEWLNAEEICLPGSHDDRYFTSIEQTKTPPWHIPYCKKLIPEGFTRSRPGCNASVLADS
jgi:hypothetical protein